MNEQTAAKIRAERQRQIDRWGRGNLREFTPGWILVILLEEVVEVARAVRHLDDPPAIHENARRRRLEQLEAEIVQVAAVAAAWLDDCFSSEVPEAER